jgi:hemoglobin-like flavoprotein
MSTDAQLVAASWRQLLAAFSAAQAGALLYEMLFQQSPRLAAALFRGVDGAAQGGKLIAMVGSAVAHADDLGALGPALAVLGERHAGYGVVAAHYPAIQQALLATLSLGLGDAMTPEVAAAWRNVYAAMQAAMLKGQYSPRGVALARAYRKRHGPSYEVPVAIAVSVVVVVTAVFFLRRK